MVGQEQDDRLNTIRLRRGRRKVHWTFALVVVLIAVTIWLMRLLYKGVNWPRFVLAIYPLAYALLFFRTVLVTTSAGWWELYTSLGLLLVFMGGMLVTDADVTAFLSAQRGDRNEPADRS